MLGLESHRLLLLADVGEEADQDWRELLLMMLLDGYWRELQPL